MNRVIRYEEMGHEFISMCGGVFCSRCGLKLKIDFGNHLILWEGSMYSNPGDIEIREDGLLVVIGDIDRAREDLSCEKLMRMLEVEDILE